MALAPLHFDSVTPAQWAAIAQQVTHATGVAVTANTGQASAQGFAIAWAYDGASNLLIQVLDGNNIADKSVFSPWYLCR